MTKEFGLDLSLFSALCEKSPAVSHLFNNKNEDYWVDLKVAQYVNKDALARLFTQDRYISHKRKHVNIAVFNLLYEYCKLIGLEVKDVSKPINGKKGRFIEESLAKEFLVFASDYLTLNPELRVKIIDNDNFKKSDKGSLKDFLGSENYELDQAKGVFPRLNESWLERIIVEKKQLHKKIKSSKTKQGFGILSDEVQRSFFNLNDFLNFSNFENSPFWIRAGDKDNGYFALTPIENLTRLLIWKETNYALNESEQKVFIDNILLPLWKAVFRPANLLTEVHGREGLFVSRVKYFQAIYVLDKIFEIPKLSFDLSVSRVPINFKECNSV